MDTVSVPAGVWSIFVILPVITTTVFCIRCRRRIPTRIPQCADYNKPSYTMGPSSSFIVLTGTHYQPRTMMSPSMTSQYNPFLSIPSPDLSQQRSNSIGANMNEGHFGIRVGHGTMLSVNNSWKNKSSNDEEDDDNNCNESSGGYIEVIPDIIGPEAASTNSVFLGDAIRTSISSVATDDNYENVDTEGEVKTSNRCSNDNYVNVGDHSDAEDMRQSGESSEYINVDNAPKPSDEGSEDENDYVNVESRKVSRAGRDSSC